MENYITKLETADCVDADSVISLTEASRAFLPPINVKIEDQIGSFRHFETAV